MSASSSDLCLLSAAELRARYAAGTLSPVAVTEACLQRIAELNPSLNAFCLVDRAGALQAARESEERWKRSAPLSDIDGVPTSVKDLLITKGWPTLRGDRGVASVAATLKFEEDAPCVARLREAGAVLIGKTTTPDLGHKGVTHNGLTGVTRSAWDPATTPGGSSGGAAVAAATGMAALNLGTDGGGSIRIPASFGGCFGIKPTFGVVPAYPASPFGTLAHVGPMTRTVTDAAMMLRVIGRYDHRDWFSPNAADVDYVAKLSGGVRGLRVAFAPTINNEPVDEEVAGAVAHAVAKFERELGCTVERVEVNIPRARDVFYKLWSVGAFTALHTFYTEEQRALMDATLQMTARDGAAVPLLEYTQATLERAAIGRQLEELLHKYDLLLTPTMPVLPFEAGMEVPLGHPRFRDWVDWTPFTYPFNLSQQPAASVVCGLSGSMLPIGLQIVGKMFSDDVVLRAAHAFEAVAPPPTPSLAALRR